jgi:hypothetical protein
MRTQSPIASGGGHPIRDFIPIPPGRYSPHNTWRETLDAREEANVYQNTPKELPLLNCYEGKILKIGDDVHPSLEETVL